MNEQNNLSVEAIRRQKCQAYQHSENTCACSSCTCNQCKCKVETHVVDIPRRIESSYQRFFTRKPQSRNEPMRVLEYRDRDQKFGLASQYQQQFKRFEIQKRERYESRERQRLPLKFAGLTSYQQDYPIKIIPKSELIQFKPIDRQLVHVPFNVNSTYQQTFVRCRTETDEQNPIVRKTYQRHTNASPSLFMKTQYQEVFSKQPLTLTKSQKPTENSPFVTTGDNSTIYRTNYSREYQRKKIGKCEALHIIETLIK